MASCNKWLLSFGIMFRGSFTLWHMPILPFFLWMMTGSIDGHLGCFHVLVVSNNTCISTYTFLWRFIFFHGYTPRSTIAVAYGRHVSLSAKLLQCSGPHLTRASVVYKVPIAPPCCQHMLNSSSFQIAIPVNVKWNLYRYWIYVPLKTNDFEHLFTFLYFSWWTNYDSISSPLWLISYCFIIILVFISWFIKSIFNICHCLP